MPNPSPVRDGPGVADREAGLSPLDALERQVEALGNAAREGAGQAQALRIQADQQRRKLDRLMDRLSTVSGDIGRHRDLNGPKPGGELLGEDPSHWRPTRVTAGHGVDFIVVMDSTSADPVSAALAAGYLSEPTQVSLMLQLVQPGDWVLDLGAHIGMFSLAASAQGCKVIALEASPLNAALLRSAAWRNGFHNLHVVNAAASDRGGELAFLANGPWGHVAWEDGAAGAIRVPAIMVQDLPAAFGCAAPSLIKMDVEGSEVKALAGMRTILEGPAAPPVLFESNAHTLELAGTSPQALLAALGAYGYRNYLVEPGRLTELDADELQPHTIVDALAVKGRAAGLGDWEIAPKKDEDQLIREIVAESSHINPDCRIYAARTMLTARPSLRSDPRVREALATLATDPVDRVRAAIDGPAGSPDPTPPKAGLL